MSIIERIVVFGFRLGTGYLVAKLKYMMSRGAGIPFQNWLVHLFGKRAGWKKR